MNINGILDSIWVFRDSQGYMIAKIAIQVVVLFLFYLWFAKRNKVYIETGFSKWYGKFIWLAMFSILFNLTFITYIFIGVLASAPAMAMALYPSETKEFLFSKYGRVITKDRVKYLLSKQSKKELSEGVYNLTKTSTGSIILIAKSNPLEEIVQTGDFIGELPVKKEIIEWIFSDNSPFNRGAIVIRDDKIVAVNCRISTLIDNYQIRRENIGNRIKAISGAMSVYDCIGISTSQTNATISFAGWLNGEQKVDANNVSYEYNLQNGLTAKHIEFRLEDYLSGSGDLELQKSISEKLYKLDNPKSKQNKPLTEKQLEKERQMKERKEESERLRKMTPQERREYNLNKRNKKQ